MEYQNPFADYGTIINGNRFIGRQDDLRVIESRVLRPKEAGNLAIIGEPRIGKSSLVWKAVIDKREELIKKRLLPIWLNLANFDTAAIFFRSLVTECYEQLEEINWLNKSIDLAKERALADQLSWTEGYGRIQRFFEKVKKADVRIIFILDEFDHARVLFKNDISGFQGLRELSYRPEWRVNFITISRRTIKSIELKTQAISTLDGIFHKHYLSMFNNNDLNAYFLRFFDVKININEQIRKKIQYYCGSYPYLLEMLGYVVVEYYYEKDLIDIDSCMKNVEGSFFDQYDRLIGLMKEDETLTKLLQIIFGPAIDVKQSDVEDFLRYGLIYQASDGIYQAYSQHFQSYLKLIERDIDLWSVWKEVEVGLRSLITERMLTKYGEKWIQELEKNEKFKEIFVKCREAQQKEFNTFGNRASDNLLDFTYPKQLFEIITQKTEWNSTFKFIFNKDKNYWEQRAQLLSRVRNPLAHNRDQVVYEHERKIAMGYCEEILEILNSVDYSKRTDL